MKDATPSRTLQEEWEEISRPLFASGGVDNKFPYGIAGNTALAETLRELSRAYLPKCEEKFVLLYQKQALEKTLTANQDCDIGDIDAQLDSIELAIKKFDSELVQINAHSLRALMSSAGFPKVADAERSKTAVALLSPVIRYAVAAACVHSGYIVDITDDPRLIGAIKTIVPKSFGGKGS